MSDSENEEVGFYGTPLEQFEEDDVPRKKRFTIEDQIATDKHGRRRFHGAFTGGFSAGFYNSVGTLEGWKPTIFKSSRSQRIEISSQKPEDFMDDEDTDEYGIAPSILQARPEYSGSQNKRSHPSMSDGPIPGEPVLRKMLEPAKETIGVKLLMKMGWKPGQGIGPRLTRLEKNKSGRKSKQKPKIYGCSLPPEVVKKDDTDDDDDDDEEELELVKEILLAPDDLNQYIINPKMNTFGLDYHGLDKRAILSTTVKQSTLRIVDDKNRKLSITGQAFGVGAFEEEDEDIYGHEDMTNYDFSLDVKKRKDKTRFSPAIKYPIIDGVLEGFVRSNIIQNRKVYAPPELPPNYLPVHYNKKSRFSELKIDEFNKDLLKQNRKKEILTAETRTAMLNTNDEIADNEKEIQKEAAKITKSLKQEGVKDDKYFRPFLADPPKQARYDKFLSLVKIGAKDAFAKWQPLSMTEWERTREVAEFEQAAKLYRPLAGFMADRFTVASYGVLEDPLDIKSVLPAYYGSSDEEKMLIEAAQSKKFGKLTRQSFDWQPCSLLCKGFNIPEPNTQNLLKSVAAQKNRRQKTTSTIFDYLDAATHNNFDRRLEDCVKQRTSSVGDADKEIIADKDVEKQEVTEKNDNKPENEDDKQENVSTKESKNIKNKDLEKLEPINKIDIIDDGSKNDDEEIDSSLRYLNLEDEEEKLDLFKSIFCDSEEEEEENVNNLNDNAKIDKNDKIEEEVNSLRNMSPPRGIFAGLDLDALRTNKISDEFISKNNEPVNDDVVADKLNQEQQNSGDDLSADDHLFYGPTIPQNVTNIQNDNINLNLTNSSSSEDKWIEKKKDKHTKKIKKSKKNKKDKDKKKSKKKKHNH